MYDSGLFIQVLFDFNRSHVPTSMITDHMQQFRFDACFFIIIFIRIFAHHINLFAVRIGSIIAVLKQCPGISHVSCVFRNCAYARKQVTLNDEDEDKNNIETSSIHIPYSLVIVIYCV